MGLIRRDHGLGSFNAGRFCTLPATLKMLDKLSTTTWSSRRFEERPKMATSAFPRPKLCFMEDDARVHKRLDQYPEPRAVSVKVIATRLLIADAW